MLLMGGIYALLHIGFIQTSLVACVTYYIESTTGVKIQIEGVDFRPMRSLVLEDVLLRDFREDTLFYCEKLSVKIDSFNLAKRVITIEELLLDKADVHLWVQDSTNNTNVEMLLEALNRNSGTKNAGVDDGSKSPSWWMGLHKITFRKVILCSPIHQEGDFEPSSTPAFFVPEFRFNASNNISTLVLLVLSCTQRWTSALSNKSSSIVITRFARLKESIFTESFSQ